MQNVHIVVGAVLCVVLNYHLLLVVQSVHTAVTIVSTTLFRLRFLDGEGLVATFDCGRVALGYCSNIIC